MERFCNGRQFPKILLLESRIIFAAHVEGNAGTRRDQDWGPVRMAGFGGSHSPAVGLDPPERRALTQVSGERELGAVGSQSRSAGALCGRRTRALQALGGHRAKWLAMLLATSAGFAGAFVQSPGVIRVGWTSQGTAGRSALGAASFISERRPAMATMRMRPRFVLFSSLTMSDEDKEQDIVKRIEVFPCFLGILSSKQPSGFCLPPSALADMLAFVGIYYRPWDVCV